MMAQLCYHGNVSHSSMNKLRGISADPEGRSLKDFYYHYIEYTSNQTSLGQPGEGWKPAQV